MTPTPETTDEALQRARDFVTNRLLDLANAVGAEGQRSASVRAHLGMAPDPACEVIELSARMLFWLSSEVYSGNLVPGLLAPRPSALRPTDADAADPATESEASPDA